MRASVGVHVILIGILAFLSGYWVNGVLNKQKIQTAPDEAHSAHDEAQEMFLRAVSKSIEEGYLTINHQKVEEMAEGEYPNNSGYKGNMGNESDNPAPRT